jgi:hypothetical protein
MLIAASQVLPKPIDVREAVRHVLPVLPHPAKCGVPNRPGPPARTLRNGGHVHFNNRPLLDLHVVTPRPFARPTDMNSVTIMRQSVFDNGFTRR